MATDCLLYVAARLLLVVKIGSAARLVGSSFFFEMTDALCSIRFTFYLSRGIDIRVGLSVSETLTAAATVAICRRKMSAVSC